MTLAVGALTLAGCGGGPLSHGDFVKRADAVCSAYRTSVQGLRRPKTYAQIVALVQKSLPLYEAALRKLEALKPPAADETAVALWLDADRRVAAAERALGKAALRRDYPSVVAASSQVEAASVASRQAAAELGLKVCASGR